MGHHEKQRYISGDFVTVSRTKTKLYRGMQDARLNAGLTQEALADALERTHAWINNEESGARVDSEPGIVKVWRWCEITDSIEPIRALADSRNCVLIPLPSSNTPNELSENTAKAAIESAEAVAEIIRSMADGKVSPAELEKARKEIRDAIEAFMILDFQIQNQTPKRIAR